MKLSTVFLALLLAAFALASPTLGQAQTYAYTVYLDTDNDASTGCTVATAAGTVAGVEASLTADVAIANPSVTGQRLATCNGGTMTASTTYTTGYPVGFALGPDALDVIELGAPVHAFGLNGDGTWRITFGAHSPLLGAADLTASTSVIGMGLPLIPVLVPATSLALLGALALTLLVVAGVVVRRNPQLLSIVAVASAVAISGIAWAAAHVLDGQIGDWPATALLADPANDATQPEPQADIRQAFAERSSDSVYFRIDVAQTRLSVLIPPLLNTAFSIPENSPNGTVLGPVRLTSTGLSSLLTLTPVSQTPGTAFAFDSASTNLSVSNTTLLNFETNPQFNLAFTAQVAGAPGFTLPVAVNIAVADVNEVPQIAPQSFSASEHEAVGVAIGTVVASDVDAGINGQLGFSIDGGSGLGLFAIGSASGQITVAGPLDLAASPYTLLVRVNDGGTPQLSATATMTINVYNKNDAPTAVALAPSSVTENLPAATLIGTLSTADVDIGDTHTYSLTCATPGANDASVAVAGTLLRTAASLNYEATPTLTVCVRSTDAGGLFFDQALTITVIDADDLPVAVDDAATINEDAPATAIPILANDSDEDGDAFTIATTTQPANGVVAITGGGTGLTYAPAANFCNSLAGTTDDFSYTLTPGGASATVRVTVTCINDAPVLTLPAAQIAPPGTTLVFGVAQGNAISVADVDAGTGLLRLELTAEDGTLTLATISGLATVTGNGSAAVVATGTLAALNAAVDGLSFVSPLTVPADGAVTLTFIANDQGNSGTGGALSDTGTVDVGIDAAPTVQSTTPANGDTVANTVTLSITFSEAVNVTAGGVTLTCNAGPNLITGGASGSNVTNLAPTYAAPLPAGACTLTVLAANVTDVDSIDPPDAMAANVVVNFTVDAAPTVTATSPANGAIVANNVPLSISFSEAVDASAGAVTLTCGGPNLITGGATGTGVTTLAPTYTAPLPSGACTLTVVAANIDDSDAFDPPANLPANHVVSFTVDAAPAFVSATPAAAAVVGTGATVSFTFDEPVNALAGAITLTCGTAITGSISGSGSATLTFTPSVALPEGTSCTATAVAANIGDSDAIDPPDHPVADVVRQFSVDAAPTVVSITPANGSTDVGLASNIVVTFSEPVNFTASAFTLSCGTPIAFTMSGMGTNTATIDPTPATLPINTLCQFSVNAALVTDVDLADPPDAGSGTTTVSFITVNDLPPSVTASTPGNGSIVANNVALSITFSEPVNVTAGGITLDCGTGNLITGGASGSNVTSLAPTYVGSLPNGATCTLTVLAANVTDVDVIDPPDAMVADVIVNFTVDAAPSVTTISPANAATGVAINRTITVNFSESVDIANAGAFSLECPLGLPRGFTVTTPASLPASATSYTLTPAANLPEGTTCTVLVIAAAVEDTDSFDPPGTMLANFSSSFTTDTAPTVTTVTPANNAVVNTTPTITVDFSESVNLDAGVFTLNCGSVIATTPTPSLPASGVTSISFAPATALPAGTNCTATLIASAVHDADSNDPPDTMAANHVWNFSVDAAPTVVSITPANGATDVNPTSTLTLTFSESVNFTAGSFTLVCNGNPTGFTVVTASPASVVVLDPVDNAVAGAACTVTVIAAQVSDTDAIDPPDTMVANYSASISFGAIANDDTVAVTPHLTVSTAAGAINLTDNDLLGTGQITGYGFAPACTGTTPGNQLNAGATNGRLTISASGAFSYEPPAGVTNATRTFCYTVTGGDTANVAFNLQNVAKVWFVDAAAAAGGNGTQAQPFQTPTSANAVSTANDTLYIAYNATAYTNGGIALKNGMRLIGQGATGTLSAYSGVTPVAGSAFPALLGTGNRPTLIVSGTVAVNLGSGNTLRGFNIGDTGAAGIHIRGASFGTLTVDEIDLSGSGMALELVTGTLAGSGFGNTSVTASNSRGIWLDGVAGSLSLGGGAIAGTAASGSASAVYIVNSPAALTYSGTISKTNAGQLIEIASGNGNITFSGNLTCNTGCTGISVSNRTGGTVTFSGTSKVLTTATAPAIALANNGGATLAFSVGGLQVNTTTATAFSATGGGTVTVTGTGNTLTSGTGTALNVSGTSIGAAGMGFYSISANGAAKGIILNTTGSAGGLSVTGTGTTNASGGTIQSISQRGGEFINTANLSLSNMNFTNANTAVGGTCTDLSTTACNAAIYLNGVNGVTLNNLAISGITVQQGINGINVNGFALSNSTLTGCGSSGSTETACIKMRGLTGTSSITGSDLAFPGADVVEIVNSTGSLTLNVNNSTFRDSQSSTTGNTGLQVRSEGNANTVVNVTNSNFLRIRTVGLHATAIGSARNDVDVSTSTFDPDAGAMIGMSLEADDNGVLVFNVQNNPRVWSRVGPAINVFGDTNANINGRIQNNPDVRVLGGVGSGIRSNINKNALAWLDVRNNTVNIDGFDAGIDLSAIGKTVANSGGAITTLHATVLNNAVTIGSGASYGIILLDATNHPADTNALCVNLRDNSVVRDPASIFSARMRVTSSSGFFRMEGFATNAQNTWSARGNTPTTAGEVSYGGSGTFEACTTQLPTNPTLN